MIVEWEEVWAGVGCGGYRRNGKVSESVKFLEGINGLHFVGICVGYNDEVICSNFFSGG